MTDFRTESGLPKQTKWSERSEQHELWARRMWRIFYGSLAILLLSIITFSFLTPSFKKLEDPSLNLASEVFAGDDTTVLGRIYVQNRAPVGFNQLPKHLFQALIATEDKRFYNHAGIDPEALARVLKGALTGQKQGGGSTLTMQLAKLLYSDRDFKDMNVLEKAFGYYYRKLSEMITAVKLERAYTKEEIMTMYLNTYDFGNNAPGIRAASEVYFAKKPDQLSLEESATFVAMCNNSSLFNPIRRNEKTRTRRNLVLERTCDAGYIKRAVCDAAKKTPLDVSKFKTQSHNDGMATYFRTTLGEEVKRLLKDRGITKSDGSNYDVYRDGLRIYTTIDPQMQFMAEEALREHMSALQAKYFRVWKGRDPWTYRDSETTDDMIRIRVATLEAQIRNSYRYQLMKGRILDDLTDKIEDDFEGLNLMDSDIVNMLREEAKSGHFDAMLKTNSISAKRAEVLQKIMRGDYWRELRTRWNALQAQVKSDFAKPTKMKVFAYNAAGEKDTTMTPLDSIRYHKMHLQIGSLGVDPVTGFVKFWVGGIGHKYFQFDHVKSERQVGSTFKPFVYSAAMNSGMSPCKSVHDVQQTIGVNEGTFGLATPWSPKNSGGFSGGYMTLWDALKESKNSASVAILKEMGSTTPIREIVNELGISVDAKSSNGQLHVPKNPAICLGAVDLQVYEMAGAYTAFANQGAFVRPLYIRKITDKSGRILYQGISETRNSLNKSVAYTMMRMLKYNVKGAPGISKLKSDVGGKTGTTNDYRDGWFMGITPQLVVGTWVGGEDQWIRFLRIEDGQGGAMARPFFSNFMTKLESANLPSYDPTARFADLGSELSIVLDCSQYSEPSSGGGIPTESVPSEFNPNRFQDEEQPARATPSVPGAPTKTPTAANPNAPQPKKKPKAIDDGFGG